MTLSCIRPPVTLFCAASQQLFQYFTFLRAFLYFVLILPVIFLKFLHLFPNFTGILKSFCFFARNFVNFLLFFYNDFHFLRAFLKNYAFLPVIARSAPLPHNPETSKPAPLETAAATPSKFCYKPQNSLVSFSAAYGIMEIS